MEATTTIDAIIGQENVFDVDTTMEPLNSSTDQYTFKAAHKRGGTAVISKAKGSGITVADEPTGKLTVKLDPSDTSTLLAPADYLGYQRKPLALVYEVTVDPGGGGKPQTVASGVLMLARQVT